MKTLSRLMMVVAVISMMSCRDRAAEKKIAELESRLAQVEGTKTGSPTTVSPAAVNTPPAEKPAGPLPVVEFEKIEHDFGTVSEGQKVSYVYKFKNNGQAPLIIQDAKPSCGCTVPEWSKEPIPVGGSGFVKAEFDTNGKQGVQTKTITVTANTWPPTTTLNFKAMVTARPTGANGPAK